jgi:hypothetical protein
VHGPANRDLAPVDEPQPDARDAPPPA